MLVDEVVARFQTLYIDSLVSQTPVNPIYTMVNHVKHVITKIEQLVNYTAYNKSEEDL